MYEINYSKPAERYFKKIKDKQLLATFKTAIDNLKSPGTVLKQPFRGFADRHPENKSHKISR